MRRAFANEAKRFGCLVRWLTGRHDGRADDAHRYGRGMRTLLAVLLGVTLAEGAVAELVLLLVLPHSPWPLIGLVLHAYALLSIAGMLATLHVCPHRVDAERLLLCDGVSVRLTVPRQAITAARADRRDGPPRSGFVVDGASATLAYGEANVTLTLDPARPVDVCGAAPVPGLRTLHVSADDPARLLAALRDG